MSAMDTEEIIETAETELPGGWRPWKLPSSSGEGDGGEAVWRVAVQVRPGQIVRRVWMGEQEWVSDKRTWCPEMTIWPGWSPRLPDEEAGTPLQGVHDYWSASGDRLRDSAKWMAAAIGASLAALVGTSPLALMRDHFSWLTVALAVPGILLLGFTMYLVLQVMRPQSVSYADVQIADRTGNEPLRAWKAIVEAQQDLYLPCGIKCLTSLRQSMIIEEATLIALAHTAAAAGDAAESARIGQAQIIRSARLRELRDAAARVATIGEFYRVQHRSTLATNLGLPCGLAGTVLIVLAFVLPHV
jgi:hypothetical protein